MLNGLGVRRRALAWMVAMTALLLPDPHRPALAKVFDPASFTLANGLQVVVVTNSRAPVVSHQIWYKVGSADEPRGKSGIAHYLEHLMFKGTPTIPPGEFSRIVARNGGRDNAFTTFDYTGYYQNVAADRLELVMQMEADRMVNLRLAEADAVPELDVVLDERRQRIAAEPGAQFAEQVQTALFLNHPYRIPIIGWEHEIRALTYKDAEDFYHTWYAPNNAVLIVAGAVTPQAVKSLAEKYFGPIPARPVPQRARPAEPPRVAAVRLDGTHPRVRQVNWSRRWIAPAYGNDPHKDADALDLLAEIIGGSQTARLYRALVIDQPLAVSAGADYDASRRDYGQFGVFLSVRPGVEIAEVERGVEAELARLLKDGVTDEEIAKARKSLLASAVFARDSLATPPRAIGVALTSGQTLDDVESWPERISAVTKAQIDQAARRLLQPNVAVTAILSPPAAVLTAASSPSTAAAVPVPAGGSQP